MNNRLYNLLGLCARAGRLVSGEQACVQAVRDGRAKLVFLDASASANAAKALGDACRTAGIELVTKESFALGDAIGKPGRMAAAITDESFAAQMIKL